MINPPGKNSRPYPHPTTQQPARSQCFDIHNCSTAHDQIRTLGPEMFPHLIQAFGLQILNLTLLDKRPSFYTVIEFGPSEDSIEQTRTVLGEQQSIGFTPLYMLANVLHLDAYSQKLLNYSSDQECLLHRHQCKPRSISDYHSMHHFSSIPTKQWHCGNLEWQNNGVRISFLELRPRGVLSLITSRSLDKSIGFDWLLCVLTICAFISLTIQRHAKGGKWIGKIW